MEKNTIEQPISIDDATAKKYIIQDLRAAISLFHVILNNPAILEQVTDIIVNETRDVAPVVDAIQRVQKQKEVDKELDELDKK